MVMNRYLDEAKRFFNEEKYQFSSAHSESLNELE
jgi:hypothetical protein